MAKYNLQAVRQKFKESHPEIPEWIEFTLNDDKNATTFRIHHPLFQSNDERRAMNRARKSQDDFEMGNALLGDQWDEYEAEGGQVGDLMLLVNQIGDDLTDVDDKGNPTTL